MITFRFSPQNVHRQSAIARERASCIINKVLNDEMMHNTNIERILEDVNLRCKYYEGFKGREKARPKH